MNGKNGQTITVAIYSLVARFFNGGGPIFAGSLVIITPIVLLFLLLQMNFIKCLTAARSRGKQTDIHTISLFSFGKE